MRTCDALPAYKNACRVYKISWIAPSFGRKSCETTYNSTMRLSTVERLNWCSAALTLCGLFELCTGIPQSKEAGPFWLCAVRCLIWPSSCSRDMTLDGAITTISTVFSYDPCRGCQVFADFTTHAYTSIYVQAASQVAHQITSLGNVASDQSTTGGFLAM